MKILFILIFVIIAFPIKSKEPIYCININSYEPYISNTIINQNLKNRCPQEISSVEISKKLFDEMKYVQNFYLKKASTLKVNTHFEKKYYADDPEFQKEKKDALKKIYLSSIDEIKEYEKYRETQIKEQQLAEQQEVKRKEEEKKQKEEDRKAAEATKGKQKQSRLIELEKLYGKKCTGGIFSKGHEKNSENYNNCLIEQNEKALIAKKEAEDKIISAEEEKKKKLAEKKEKEQRAETKKKEQETTKKDNERNNVPQQTKKDYGNNIIASSGTGFFITKAGHIITNNHVIDHCNLVNVYYKGEPNQLRLLAADRKNDLAILKADFRPDDFFSIAKEDAILMEEIYVAGYPFGKNVSSTIKVTKGVVSSLSGIGNNFSNIQIDAALQVGNSGGPIINKKGNVIGVAVQKLDYKKVLEATKTLPENTNFGIKSSTLNQFLNSNKVSTPSPRGSEMSIKDMGEKIEKATVYLDCWMSAEKIQELRGKKVFFQQ